jgi:HEPN domain-containing protein
MVSKHHCIANLAKTVLNVGKPSWCFAFSQQAASESLKLLQLMPNQRVKDFQSHL